MWLFIRVLILWRHRLLVDTVKANNRFAPDGPRRGPHIGFGSGAISLEAAQDIIRQRAICLSDDNLLAAYRRLLEDHGYVSGLIIDETDAAPSRGAYRLASALTPADACKGLLKRDCAGLCRWVPGTSPANGVRIRAAGP
ncbi:MAG: hypothetical protein C0511_09180 [Hyphomicrobium sp.]|nr:hypothetical protein [Hyphomicrobium sp.]